MLALTLPQWCQRTMSSWLEDSSAPGCKPCCHKQWGELTKGRDFLSWETGSTTGR